MDNPSKIMEDGVEYWLGEFNDKQVIYDFDFILAYLNIKGKLLFDNHIKIYDEDAAIIRNKFYYFKFHTPTLKT